MKSAPAIAFDYRPSRLLALALIGVALFALVAIVLCGLEVWIKVLLLGVTLAYAARTLHAFRRAPFGHVTWHAAGHWRVRDADGNEHVAEFLGGTVLGRLIVLNLRTGPKRRVALPLLPDNCDAEMHRRLRVRLAVAPPAAEKT